MAARSLEIWIVRMMTCLTAVGLTSCGAAPSYQERLSLPDYEAPGQAVQERLLAGLARPATDEAQPEDAEISLSLRDAVVSVLRNNRDIRVAAHGPDQARAGVLEAQAAYDPEAFAEWQYARNNNPSATPGADSQYRNHTEQAGLRQRLPSGAVISGSREWASGVETSQGYPDYRGQGAGYVLEITQPILNGFLDREARSALAISRLGLTLSEEELRQAMLESAAAALEAYWNVALADEDVRIYEETLGLAENLLARERKRRGEGVSTELDVARAQEAVASRTAALLSAKDQRHTQQERLKLLLNNPAYPVGGRAFIKTTENLETPIIAADLERSLATAQVWRPERRQADLAIRGGEIRQKYARHNLWPKLDLVGRLKENDRRSDASIPGYEYDSVGRDWSVGLLLTMPLGNMKARAELERAESELAQSLEEKRNAEDVIAAEVKAAVMTLNLVGQEIPVSQRALEAARRIVDGEWARFEINQVGNRDLLQAQDLLALSERSRIQSLVRYNIALIRLLAAEGTLLEHLGVRMIQEP